jgi:uncharacterized protein YbcC (UPF0753/DUF2309 family)
MTPQLDEIVRRACAKIAPTWPLDRFIAVNPFWNLVESPLPEVAAKLQSLSGAQLLMPRAWYRQAYAEGRLRDEHLQAAIDAHGADLSLGNLRALLEQDEPKVPTRARVSDLVEPGCEQPSTWRSFVTHSISQCCAAYFDEGQATFGPHREGSLYESWRRQALDDRSPALLMGATDYRACARELPKTASDLIATAMSTLNVAPAEQESYLWGLLLDQNGWASWCAYRRWTARLEGKDDDAISDLLAIRLAWEWLLFRMGGAALARRWTIAMASWPSLDAEAAAARRWDWLLQSALEIAWQAPILAALPAGFHAEPPGNAAVQAVFCIDVRSETFRRALEATAPSVQTLGFAGFFGLPMEYRAAGTTTARPQLPGLLAPRLRATDIALSKDATQRARQLEVAEHLRTFKKDALSTFTFVEALGLTYARKLLTDGLGAREARPNENAASCSKGPSLVRKPRLVGTVAGEPLALDTRVDLAVAMLRGMSLTHDFARIVLLAGHGSTTRNNPHAAGLDCGACCGQTGEVNARIAAALLNDPEVRKQLRERGIQVTERTWFVAALHDTTTDDVTLFELDEVPPSHCDDIAALKTWLTEAGSRTRSERATRLDLREAEPRLSRALRTRATDWAQVRAEWGLAGNAALIVAPRERCRHLNLQGRSFLHEYRYREDEDFSILELIMTAPMVVSHWINFQYYASTVDNARYGSGNKVLHNVVGGHLGVFEGNGGDLRIGLPMQSLHDGKQWVHTPLRLSVFIEAPRSAIDAVLHKHEKVRNLVDNAWLSLFQIDEREGLVYAMRDRKWWAQAPSNS